MSEFKEVMRQYKRMREAFGLRDDCSDFKITITDFINKPDNVERQIMAWAKEHPEPPVPTWREFLLEHGFIIERKNEPNCRMISYLWDESIPRDLAEKIYN